MIFDADRIEQLRKLTIVSGLHVPEKRGFLFFGLKEYEATLQRQDNPSDQVLSDLQHMSLDGWVGDLFPLVTWLRNAASQTTLYTERANLFSQSAEDAAKTPRPTKLFGLVNASPKEPVPAAPKAPLPPGPVQLDAARKESLLKAMETCVTVEDLQAALLKCLGNAPNLSAAPGQAAPSVRDLALQSIELLERQKLTVVFLQFVVATARCSDDLRKEALAIFPELASASRPFATIVDDAASYFKNHAAAIATALGDDTLADRLSLSVAELKCYKSLHEAIHQAKNSTPPAAPEGTDAATIREFKLALRQYLAALNTARSRAQGALDGLPPTSGVRDAKQPAITLIGGYASRIEVALGRNDIDTAVTVLEDTVEAINPMLDEFNQNIVEMANRLLDGPLDRLRSAIAGAANDAGPPPSGVNVMAALRLALLTRVLGHTRWQEIDKSLFALGGAFRSEPAGAFKSFTRRWSVARKQIPILTDSDAELDTAKLQALARKIDTALVEAEKSIGTTDDAFNSVVLDPFDEFRYETQQQFIRIDSALKRNCAELVRIVAVA
jgi:hypothetical protein